MASLSEIYEGAEPTPVAVQEPEPVATEPQGVKEAEPAPVESPSPVTQEERMVPLKALEEERRKRQEAEARFQQQEPKKTPDVFEDPEGYQQHMMGVIQQATASERFGISKFLAKRDHPDLEQKLETFQEIAKQNPQYLTQVSSSPSPYHEMAEIVAKHEKMKAMEDLPAYEAKLRAEIEAKVRAEIKAEAEKTAVLKASIPTSLVGTPSKGSIKGSSWAGPTDLKSIYK